MKTTAKTRLRTLKDADLTTRDPAEDIRSRTVRDADGEELGKVESLLIDDKEHKVRFMTVAGGGFLGIGKDRTLIPIDAITEIGDDVVRIDQSRDRVAAAPAYDPEVVDDDYFSGLYGYYGYAPYWGAGYVYPGYPRPLGPR